MDFSIWLVRTVLVTLIISICVLSVITLIQFTGIWGGLLLLILTLSGVIVYIAGE
jgi:hypothetical protein